MKKTSLILALCSIAALTAPPAHAGGIIGDFVEAVCGNCGAGKTMDKTHKEMGNPLDHAANAAAGAVANTVVPGSGPAVTGALETRDAIRKQQ